MQPIPRSGRSSAAADVSAHAPTAGSARRAPPQHDAISRRQRGDADADLFPHASSLMAQQHRQPVRPARLDHMEIAVAHPTRFDPDEHFVVAWRVDLDLFEVEAPDLAQDDAAIHAASRSRATVPPISASVRSVSAASCCNTASTPGWPPTASPYTDGRPRSTAFAPSASAFRTSAPPRIPPSIKTGASGPTPERISSSASSEATAPSTWRPPRFETTMP